VLHLGMANALKTTVAPCNTS